MPTVLLNLVRFLNYSLKTKPVRTNAVLYGTMFVSAEFLNQTLSKKILAKKSEPYDPGNLQRCAIFGTFVQGPLMTKWYKWLDGTFPAKSVDIIVKKLLVDQLGFTPILYAIFFISMSIMERKEHIFDELRAKFVKTYATSCVFWCPVQSANFYFIPPVYRVVYMGCAAFFWVTILCYIKNEKIEHD